MSLTTAKALQRAAEEERRLAAFFGALQRLIPEPPEVWRVASKHLVRAMTEGHLQTRFIARHRNDVRARESREFDSTSANAARGSKHQHRFARLQAGAPVECCPGRAVRGGI